ncbi:MAG: FtsX-like permease family protein [Bacillota bacterium]
MSAWRIASRFFQHDWKRYVAFVGSTAFTVMIYFLYTALIMHPNLQSGYPYAKYAVQGMKAAAVVIAIFAFLFLLYSSSSFVRLRMKELGLLSLLGVSKRQLIQIILGENLIIAAVSLAAGLGAGLLLLKLFFMGISALLRLPQELPLSAGVGVWLRTILVFGGMFAAVSVASLRAVLRRSVVELVRAGRKPKAVPRFSAWRLALGLLLLVGGYLWAGSSNPTMVLTGVVPVTLLVSVATVILMREASIACLSWLQGWSRYYYRPGPFLTISQLAYKIQDNYRVLAVTAILVAVILTAVGTAFTLYALSTSDAKNTYPVPVQLVQYGGTDEQPSIAAVDAVLAKHGLDRMPHRELVALQGRLAGRKLDIAVVPYSFYREMRTSGQEALPLGDDDEAILMFPNALFHGQREEVESWNDHVQVGEEELEFTVKPDEAGRLVNPARHLLYNLVVSDAVYKGLADRVGPDKRIHISMWTGNWRGRAMQKASSELLALFAGQEKKLISTTMRQYQTQVTQMGLLVFIGVFVSLVFVAACFSLLYSRLFTDIEEDRRYARRLQQVGVTKRELRGQALSQMAVIFFLPFVVGLLHSTVAMYALGTLTRRTVLHYGWGAALLFLFLFGAFFSGAGQLYWHSLQDGLQREAGSGAF